MRFLLTAGSWLVLRPIFVWSVKPTGAAVRFRFGGLSSERGNRGGSPYQWAHVVREGCAAGRGSCLAVALTQRLGSVGSFNAPCGHAARAGDLGTRCNQLQLLRSPKVPSHRPWRCWLLGRRQTLAVLPRSRRRGSRCVALCGAFCGPAAHSTAPESGGGSDGAARLSGAVLCGAGAQGVPQGATHRVLNRV